MKTFSNLLLAAILYLRTTIGYELLGLLLGIDQATVKRVVRRVMPLLQDRFIPVSALNKRKKRANLVHSRERIMVEHGIRTLKVYSAESVNC